MVSGVGCEKEYLLCKVEKIRPSAFFSPHKNTLITTKDPLALE